MKALWNRSAASLPVLGHRRGTSETGRHGPMSRKRLDSAATWDWGSSEQRTDPVSPGTHGQCDRS